MKLQILLLLVCAIVFAMADRECKLNTGDVFSARYPISSSNFAGQRVLFTFGGDGKSGMESTTSETIFIEWEIDDDVELAVRDFRSNPSDVGCPNHIIGSYRVTWDANYFTGDPNCFSGKLELIQDACVERTLHYHGLEIRRVRKQNTLQCGFYPEQVWRGVYPNNNNRYGGYDMSIVFSSDGESAVESSDFGTLFVEWENFPPDSPSLYTLNVRDFGANPWIETCQTRIEGHYTLVWDIDCRSVRLNAADDECIRRREQYDGLTLQRVQDFDPFTVHGDDDDAAMSLKFSIFSIALSCVLALFFI